MFVFHTVRERPVLFSSNGGRGAGRGKEVVPGSHWPDVSAITRIQVVSGAEGDEISRSEHPDQENRNSATSKKLHM